MKINKYLGRGIHNETFLKSLKKGKLKSLMYTINKEDHKDLDVQIRSDYLNIYYNGGNIAKIRGEESVEFDEFYFCLDTDRTRAEVLKDQGFVNELKEKRDLLVQKFKNGNYVDYFAEAKEVMDEWLYAYDKPEQKVKQKIALENSFGESDYTIIDLEYEVSVRSPFACELLGKNGKAKKPRFDIIAVDKAGKLCVIELKRGSGALTGVAGLKEHYDCYQHSIALKPEAFIAEMKMILQQKQDFNLIDKQVEIKSLTPEFMFAYAYASSHKEREDRLFEREYKKINAAINVIKLEQGSFKLLK